ncbi:MAG: transcriptional repressor [Cyanobacteria bacterium QS_8_64_29]|nr:MAG: transcriptional repressor [Cyanobacteria bacterium QS_8_64_29]
MSQSNRQQQANESERREAPIRSLEDALQQCQKRGMRLSRQRRSILELLWEADKHLSAREIYDRLNYQGKEIGHTSVYQNLEALSSHGIIECVEHCDGRLYGNISEAHSHINCLDTDQIVDIHVELPPELIRQIEAQTGIEISDYRIDFYGRYKAERPTQAGGGPLPPVVRAQSASSGE